MTPEFITGFFFEALKIAFILSGPILLSGLLAGIVVSMFQAATSINEMTLVFIPKMIAVGLALLICFPWMMQVLVTFTQNILLNIPSYIR